MDKLTHEKQIGGEEPEHMKDNLNAQTPEPEGEEPPMEAEIKIKSDGYCPKRWEFFMNIGVISAGTAITTCLILAAVNAWQVIGVPFDVIP